MTAGELLAGRQDQLEMPTPCGRILARPEALDLRRVQNILDLCISRFNAFSRLEGELERTRSALEERKVIDRAKGILMKTKNISEETAYQLMRKTAMNDNKKIVEIAQSVITAAELFK